MERLQTIEAYDGETGFKVAREGKPDLILLDMTMPGEDTWEVLRRLKCDSATAEVPVVTVTSNEPSSPAAMGRLWGAAGHIRKPFHPEDLGEIIKRVEGREAS